MMNGENTDSTFGHEFLKRIYKDGGTKISIPKIGRNEIWAKFRESSTIDTILDRYPKIEPILHALATAKKNSKNLQSAILSECVYTFDIAMILGLSSYSEFDSYEGKFPQFAKNEMSKRGMLPRFIYYSKNGDEFLVQAGGPNSVDACYISAAESKLLWIEYKEPAAKYGEADILYDDEGFVTAPPKFAEKHNHFETMLEAAQSKKINIFDYSSKQINFNDFEVDQVSQAIVYYFSDPDNTVVFTEDSDSNLMGMLCKDVPRFASKIEGEIRSAGRNSLKLFTKEHFYKVFADMGGIIDSSSNCEIETARIKDFRRERGDAGKITAIKVSSIYFIRLSKLREGNGKYTFALKDVYQLKSSIASKAFFEHVRVDTAKHFYLV
jgi:hypothetical protein